MLKASIYSRTHLPLCYYCAIKLNSINARNIEQVLISIKKSGRPTICNGTLGYCKQLFNHGIKLNLLGTNPESAFNVTDAGAIEKSKDRALTIDELKFFFQTARENSDSFSRDNYLACAYLLERGVSRSSMTGV